MTAPSWQDLRDIGVFAAQAVRPTLVFFPGDVTDAMVAGCASMGSAIVAWGAGRFRATFIDGAEGEDLTARCSDNGVDRDPGDEAVGVVTFSRVTAGAGGGTVPAGTSVATEQDETGKFLTYTTDTDTVFGALDLSKTANVTCTVIGTTGNVEEDSISRILDLSSLWDQTLEVTNVARCAGGNPEETDEDLRERTRNFFLTQARGTIDALIYAAKTVDGVARVSCVVSDSGVVYLYVADAEGNSNQALVDAVEAVVEGPPAWRAAGDVVYYVAATLYNVLIDVSLTVRTGVDAAAMIDTIRQAIVSAVNRLDPGETLYRDLIQSAARAVDPDAILSVRVNLPLADLVPTANQVIATTLGDVSAS